MTVSVLIDYEMLLESFEPSPEKKLMVAIIHRAILDFYSPDVLPYYRHQAARWLFSHSKDRCSLHWVCTWLTDDPDWLQESIKTMIRSKKGLTGPIVRVDTK